MSRKLFAGYDDIEFTGKDPFPAEQMMRNKKGEYLVAATSNETLAELTTWPQDAAGMSHWRWRYRLFYKLTQYWRVDSAGADASSLQVRVNGRVKYWSGESLNKKDYIDIPGGAAFENFELREKYRPGQKFYFGLTLKKAEELISGF